MIDSSAIFAIIFIIIFEILSFFIYLYYLAIYIESPDFSDFLIFTSIHFSCSFLLGYFVFNQLLS